MKCFYHNDLDGHCAAAIVCAYYKKTKPEELCQYIEVDYKDTIDAIITDNETVIIVDFSFKPKVMNRFLKVTTNIIWIDHHKTAFEYKYDKEVKGLRDKEFSGCELTWKYFFPNTQMPRAVALIGDRDKWAWKYEKETAHFCQGIATYRNGPTEDIWAELFRGNYLSTIQRDGVICLRYRENFTLTYRHNYAFETKFKGYKCIAMNLYMMGSESFGEAFNKYDICISFVFSGDCWTISLYSKKIDVSEIAKKYGGGGHKGASGFNCVELPFKKAR